MIESFSRSLRQRYIDMAIWHGYREKRCAAGRAGWWWPRGLKSIYSSALVEVDLLENWDPELLDDLSLFALLAPISESSARRDFPSK